MKRWLRGQRGQSMVEMALLLPVLLLILMALLDFGRVVFAYNTVSNAAREGARTAIVNQTLSSGTYVAASEAASQATGLGLDPTNPAHVQVRFLMPDLTTACTSRGIGCIAEVRVQYEFRAITPIIGSFIGAFTVGATTQIPIERTQP